MSSKILKRHSFEVCTQTNSNAYDDATGLPAEAVIERVNGKGNIQPLSGKEILQVEEGDRKRGILNLFTQQEITPNSTIIYKSVQYEVRSVECWDQTKLAHYKCRIVRKDVEINQDSN